MHGCCCCLRRCLGNWFPVLAELGEGRPFSLKPGCPSLFSILQRKGQAGSWCCRGGVKARGGVSGCPFLPSSHPHAAGGPSPAPDACLPRRGCRLQPMDEPALAAGPRSSDSQGASQNDHEPKPPSCFWEDYPGSERGTGTQVAISLKPNCNGI